MKYRKPSKSFTKKRSYAYMFGNWGRKLHKRNIVHELVKKIDYYEKA